MNNEYSEQSVFSILKVIEELYHLKDVDSILDRILYEARKLSRADAGSIFLVGGDGDYLGFSYVHEGTLFHKPRKNADIYTDEKVPVDNSSIVGYVASTKDSLVIDDAYNLPDNLPYKFNRYFDRKYGYKTTSILAIPLKTLQNKLVGVIELINAIGKDGQQPVPFSQKSQIYVPLFANNASVAIEHGIMNREIVLRMMKMAEMRDPKETAAHVQRVGAYSAEIYQKWATDRGVKISLLKQKKGLIRLASMLHDVGKVGIADTILKKQGKLNREELSTMRKHTVYGARLFVNNTSELDIICYDIALNHHEDWQGSGYPGHLHDIMSDSLNNGTPKKGEEIPLAARITRIADTFDALSSRRAYKDKWSDEKIVSYIKEESGKKFDPEIVEVFFQIFDLIKSIRRKYQDE